MREEVLQFILNYNKPFYTLDIMSELHKNNFTDDIVNMAVLEQLINSKLVNVETTEDNRFIFYTQTYVNDTIKNYVSNKMISKGIDMNYLDDIIQIVNDVKNTPILELNEGNVKTR